MRPYPELLGDLVQFLLEHGGLAWGGVDLLEEDLALADEELLAIDAAAGIVLVADPVAAVLTHYAA